MLSLAHRTALIFGRRSVHPRPRDDRLAQRFARFFRSLRVSTQLVSNRKQQAQHHHGTRCVSLCSPWLIVPPRANGRTIEALRRALRLPHCSHRSGCAGSSPITIAVEFRFSMINIPKCTAV